MLDSFFITDLSTVEVETGVYEMPLVVLSYAVACVASYTALAMAQVMTGSLTAHERRLFHWGGAFAMGAGIWSMHFVGMLSYRMRMEVSYDPWMTLLSMLIAIAVAWGALAIIAREKLPMARLIAGGVVLGLGICGMHYTGMAAMKMDADLRYVPGIFFLSVLIAIAASVAALWMTFMLARPGVKFRPLFQILAAPACITPAWRPPSSFPGRAAATRRTRIFMRLRCRLPQRQDLSSASRWRRACTGRRRPSSP
jgi:NO-binding membrane sensor protein with MHYT domain